MGGGAVYLDSQSINASYIQVSSEIESYRDTENRMSDNWPIVNFIVRWILGLLFVMAGYWKVFVLTPAGHAQQYFVEGFSDSWIPTWLLHLFGYGIPLLELVAGLLICIGLRTKEALIAVGLLLIVTTYGHALQQPLFDIDGHTFTRLALIVFLLLAPAGNDRYSFDQWLLARKDKRGEQPL